MAMSSSPQPLTPEAVINQIETHAAAERGKIHCFSNWMQSFAPIEEMVDGFANEVLSKIQDTEAEKLITVIKDRRGRMPLSTGITDQIIGICQQILAFGAAGVALTVGFADKLKQFSILTQKLLATVGIFYVELVATALLVLLWYLLQARFRYPSVYFAKIGNAWPFFYYANITPVDRAPVQCSRQRFRSATAYATDFIHFINRFPAESPQERLRTEIQQYFLLMSYQAYVNQFSLRLANMFMYGFSGAVLTALILLGSVLGGLL
jgi:hypothetical protein